MYDSADNMPEPHVEQHLTGPVDGLTIVEPIRTYWLKRNYSHFYS